MRVEVSIHLKKGVADPEGASVAKALRLLEFREVKGVASVKSYIIELDETDVERALRRVEEMCQKLLANPVIHRWSVRLLGEEAR